jgi:AraC-like DNA-binding protein/quercetin dioxygenase-like cupin family protein
MNIGVNQENSSQKEFHFDKGFFENPQLYEQISLYQIGDLSCKSGYEIGEHKQPCYEISYIVSGKGYYYTNGDKRFVKEGDIYLSLPNQIHNGIADIIDPFRYFYVGFDFCNIEIEHNPFTHIEGMFDKIRNPVGEDKMGVKSYFTNIFNEMINFKDYSNLVIKMCLQQIIILVYRNFFDVWGKAYLPVKRKDNSKQVVYQVVNYIDNNLFEINELPLVALKLGYSYSYLSHVFSKETGLTIQQYYNKMRFEKADEWLKTGNSTITEIANKLQYNSIHSFSKAFRNYSGISPSQYQNLHG